MTWVLRQKRWVGRPWIYSGVDENGRAFFYFNGSSFVRDRRCAVRCGQMIFAEALLGAYLKCHPWRPSKPEYAHVAALCPQIVRVRRPRRHVCTKRCES